MKTTVMLVDDHTLVREGFRSLLEELGAYRVLGEAGTGREAVEMALDLKPEVILMDLRLPDISGIEASRRILQEAPGTKIIMLSMHLGREFVTEALGAGAAGYVLKDCTAEELTEAIASVMEGRLFLSLATAQVLSESRPPSAEEVLPGRADRLTGREREVVILIAEGLSVREIAESLALSIHTVHTYRKRIMDKLGLENNASITRFAIREGLTKV